jgi:hypothetical protein
LDYLWFNFDKIENLQFGLRMFGKIGQNIKLAFLFSYSTISENIFQNYLGLYFPKLSWHMFSAIT